MDVTKRKLLEKAGWKVGDAADFLGMNAEERQLLDARVELALAIRKLRQSLGLTQKELGTKIKTTQPRIAKIERAASDVSMDQLVRAYTAVGGKFAIQTSSSPATSKKIAQKRRPTPARS